MAFDPDAYLAEGGGVKETPFDPDAYLGIQKPVGTSIGKEISQLPAALKQSFGQPLEAIGQTAQVAGFPAVATALKGAIQEPEGYVSAGQRFMEPQEGEFQIAGFAPQYAPRAIVEQTGQIIGSIGSRIAGAVTLGGLGALISPATGAAGVAAGQFAGPALFEAAQIVGPVALERAKNNGYTEPTNEDMAYAITTAAGSGLLNAFGAKYLPGGEKAVGSFSKRLAASFIGEGIPEGLQSLVQQVGETVETKKGIQVSPKQAVGEALIGGGAGAAATIVSAPFTPEQIEEQKITERANKEAENLVIGNDNPQGKAVLANKQKLEQEIADTKQVLSAIESTDPVAQKLKLELKEKEAILAAAQGQVDSIVDSNEPVVEAEKQQIELAKAITTPAEEKPATPKPLPTDVLPTETPGATYGREADIFDVFGGITRKPVSIPKPAELPTAPTIEEQTAETTYGGQTGVFDVFAGARRKPVSTEEPPVSMVGKEVIPGVTPVPVVAAQPKATKEAITAATNVANQIEEENKALEKLTKFNPPSAPTLQDARSLPDAVAKKGRTLSISGGRQERNILDPKESQKRFDDIGYERQALELPEDMNDRVSGRYGSAIANIKSLYSLQWLGAHFHGGIAVNPEVKGTQRGRIVAHELGHASHSLLGDRINKDQNVLNELQAIEELLYPGLRAKVSAASNPDASFFNYLLSPNELIAEFNVERISNPERAVQVAPTLSALLESAEKMKGLVADRKTFPTFIGAISESKERLKVKDLESRKIKEKTGDKLTSKARQWSDLSKWILKWGKEGRFKNLKSAKIALSNLRIIYEAPKSFAKRTAELTGNQELIDYVEELYPAPTEPTINETLPVTPVKEEPFGKLPTAEAETALSQRTKEAAIAEEREKIEAPIRRQESINQFLSEGATVKSRTNVVGRKKAAEGGGDITKTAYYLAHPDGKREIPLSQKEASDLEAPAITPAPVAETPTAPAPEVAPAISDETKRIEQIAIQSVDTPKKLNARLQDALDTYGVKNRKSWTIDFENKQLISPDKTTAIKWTTRNNPNEPESYTNQQTTRGKAQITKYQPTPAVSETITPAEPEGISVGNRIKLGKSPQTYIVEEAIPQTEAEKANNEQFYSVKNERTGKTQVVEKADMKQVGGKKARKMAVEVIHNQEVVTPIPEANRYTFEEAVKAVDAHFGKQGIPEGVVIVNNTTEPDLEMKAGYFVNRGQIVINLAYIAKGENLGDIIDHELGHYIFSDPEFQADFKEFWDMMTPEEKAKADQIINQFYNKDTGAVQMEEKQVRAFMQLIQDSKAMPKWKQILDKIKRWINEKLKTNFQVTDRGALAVLAVAHKRFKSGERIIREIDSGVLKTAETAQDAEYLAAVERGDMETAQRMVDEAAKAAGEIKVYARTDGVFKPYRGAFVSETVINDRSFGGTTTALFLKPGNIAGDADVIDAARELLMEADARRAGVEISQAQEYLSPNLFDSPFTKEDREILIKLLQSQGFDSAELSDVVVPKSRVVFNPSQIKSAEPVTYDDAGNVIPLSQRFRATSPDIRRMAVEPTPIEPEAKTITEGLVQGIDIGKETNMPINNKIESHIKNFAFVRGIFESASDRLRRAKFTKLATAIDDYYDQAQRRLGFANKILLPAFDEYSKQSKSTKKRIDEEVKMFFAAQENKRDTAEFFDELNPITQKIVTAWQKFGEESGKENQRIGIKVFDRGLQRWRPIGRVEKFWPRVLKPEYKRALMEPDKYQKEYNEIVEALMKSGRINTPEEAEVFISDYQGTGSQNDYFSGIEAARGQAFPEELYDYSMQVMTDYVARWAQHSSRIEQFGQKLGENSKTLWDRSRESTRDRRTIDYITAAQERVEGYYPNDPIVKGMATLNIWSSGLQLGNPASSMLNFFGGTTLNAMVGQPGAFSSYLSSFVELRKLGRELKDAREKGIVSRDLMNIVGDHQVVLESSGLAKAGQKTTDFLLKWSGFTPIEQMVRTQSMIIGKSFLRKTLSSLSKNPNSSFSKRALTWLNRNNIDADKLIVEQGTGPETDKLLRYFANISQGSYTISQTPIFTDTPIGRFLFKYQKFSTQVMRQSWKNTFEPAWRAVTNKNETLQLPDPTRQLLYRLRLAEAKELGDNRKITLDEIPKKVTKAEGKALTIIPVMMWLGASYVGGEVILRLRDMLFGVLMKGPDYEDIIRAFEDDEDDDELYLSLERAWYNLIGMGALGLIGNYAQFFMDWQDRERVKNPLDPPALSIFKETATFIQNAVDQGKITVGDVNNYLNRTFSAYRVSQRLYQTAASGLGYSDAPTVAEEMFRREVASINKYARRWAESAGLEYRTKRPMDIAPSKMTPINREIAGYLQRGEPGAAAAYAKEYLKSLPKKERANAIQSMESGARNRQPLRLGSGPMDQAEKIAFKKWLKEKVSKEKFDEIQKLDSQYQKNYRIFLNNLPNK